jgi:hypothetical protein
MIHSERHYFLAFVWSWIHFFNSTKQAAFSGRLGDDGIPPSFCAGLASLEEVTEGWRERESVCVLEIP